MAAQARENIVNMLTAAGFPTALYMRKLDRDVEVYPLDGDKIAYWNGLVQWVNETSAKKAADMAFLNGLRSMAENEARLRHPQGGDTYQRELQTIATNYSRQVDAYNESYIFGEDNGVW